MDIEEIIKQLQQILDSPEDLDYHDGVHLFHLADELEKIAMQLTPREVRNLEIDSR